MIDIVVRRVNYSVHQEELGGSISRHKTDQKSLYIHYAPFLIGSKALSSFPTAAISGANRFRHVGRQLVVLSAKCTTGIAIR